MSTNPPLISIIVPIYNVAKYLPQCLDSIVMQLQDNTELLLIDDGSIDKSPEICDSYEKKYKNIAVFHQANKGLAGARKTGLENASGEYILFVDADDYILPGHVKGIVDIITCYRCDTVAISLKGFSSKGEGKTVGSEFPEGFYDKKELIRKIYPYMLSMPYYFSFGIYPSLWSKCIKRKILLKNNHVPEKITMGEDAVMCYSCLLDANSLYISKQVTYMWRMNEASIMHKYDSDMCKKIIYTIEYMNETKDEKKWNDHSQIDAYTLMLCEIAIKNEMKNFKEHSLLFLTKNKYVNGALHNQEIKFNSLGVKLKFFFLRHRLFRLLRLFSRIKDV